MFTSLLTIQLFNITINLVETITYIMDHQKNYQNNVMNIDNTERSVDRDSLIKSHLKLVVSLAYKFRKFGELDDLIQEGNLALVKAADSYNPEIGAFATHAMIHIKNAFYESTIKEPLIKTITTKALKKAFYNHRKYADQNGFITLENRKRMSEDLNISEDAVNEFIQRNSISMESIFTQTSDLGEFELGLNVPADSSWQPENIMEILERETLILRTRDAIESLNEREKAIIKARWVDDDATDFKTLGEQFGVSFQRIQQIEKAALGKIRKVLTESENSL